VDWINYIYYNQQRLVTYTRDTVKGICRKCCTFIPNNIAPDGTITKALPGLTALSIELPKNSGINDPLTNWLEQWFEKWKGVMTSILISLIVVFGQWL
jgi:hypothetical protein